MKKVIIAAVILGLGGGAYAAGWSEATQFTGQFDALAVNASELKVLAAAKDAAAPGITKGYITSGTPSIEAHTKPVEWVIIPGGKFAMGTDDIGPEDNEGIFNCSRPVHVVDIKTFVMSKTHVTVEQYAECVDKGVCGKPATGPYCNWGVPGRERHPVNCVSWYQADRYARFKNARLPSEAEWEYAATSGGKNQKYPWGNDEPTCDKAVMPGHGGYGCGKDSTMPVCSKPAGNTEQGLCDMAGNVWQWVQDTFQDSYKDAPADGSAYEVLSPEHVLRGGSFSRNDPAALRADYRFSAEPAGFDYLYFDFGFRLARSR